MDKNTVIINEASIGALKSGDLLPKFIYNDIKAHNTSIGDCEALPGTGDYPYDYMLVKARYRGILRRLAERGMDELADYDAESLINTLSKLISRCVKIERPIRPVLEKICENAVSQMFSLPAGVMNMECKLVDKVKPNHPFRVLPEMEEDEDEVYKFKDVLEAGNAKKAIGKRRVVNALIQGAASHFSTYDGYVMDELNSVNEELVGMYEDIVLINDLLLFKKREDVTDDNPRQFGYVEVTLGSHGKKNTMEAQGIVFPLLYRESIKGIFELISAHGLPSDPKQAKYIIRRADFLMAEPWDMRFGKTLWEAVFNDGSDLKLYPFIFKNLVSMSADEFNDSMKEMIAGTELGDEIYSELTDKAIDDIDYQHFTRKMEKNIDKSLIADEYITSKELRMDEEH